MIIDYSLISYITLHIWQCHGGLKSTTSHLTRSKPSQPNLIVVWSATNKKVSRWKSETIDHSDLIRTTDPKMIHIMLSPDLTIVFDLLITRSGN